MSSFLWRCIYAVLVVVIVFAILPPLFRILNFPLSGDVSTVISIAIAGIAVLYVFKGAPLPPG